MRTFRHFSNFFAELLQLSCNTVLCCGGHLITVSVDDAAAAVLPLQSAAGPIRSMTDLCWQTPTMRTGTDALCCCRQTCLGRALTDAVSFTHAGAAIGNAAMATVTKCVGTSQAVWFDTSLAAPQCNAFVAVGSPSDGSPTGRKLSAAAQVLLTQEVPTGCKTALPVLCM